MIAKVNSKPHILNTLEIPLGGSWNFVKSFTAKAVQSFFLWESLDSVWYHNVESLDDDGGTGFYAKCTGKWQSSEHNVLELMSVTKLKSVK